MFSNSPYLCVDYNFAYQTWGMKSSLLLGLSFKPEVKSISISALSRIFYFAIRQMNAANIYGNIGDFELATQQINLITQENGIVSYAILDVIRLDAFLNYR